METIGIVILVGLVAWWRGYLIEKEVLLEERKKKLNLKDTEKDDISKEFGV